MLPLSKLSQLEYQGQVSSKKLFTLGMTFKKNWVGLILSVLTIPCKIMLVLCSIVFMVSERVRRKKTELPIRHPPRGSGKINIFFSGKFHARKSLIAPNLNAAFKFGAIKLFLAWNRDKFKIFGLKQCTLHCRQIVR